MIWTISDIHGCWDAYQELLAEIAPGRHDTLYILGDATDRGPASMRVLLDIIRRPGTVYIPGNHDYFLRRLGPCCGLSPEEGGRRKTLFDAVLKTAWMHDGGRETLAQFRALPAAVRREILTYFESAPAFVQVNAGGADWVLTHKPVNGFERKPFWRDWGLPDYLRPAVPYTRPYFTDSRIILSGHTLTATLRPDGASSVYTGNGHIVIDCGCAFGGRLGAFCLDTGETVYVHGHTP